MTIQEVIDKLIAYHPPLDDPETCDCVKAGDPGQECKKIVITTFASYDVLKAAVEEGANFVICHEPVFFNHDEETDFLEGDPVYEAKKKLIDDNNLVIYRDHDRIHAGLEGKNYDGIFYGMMCELGWKDYVIGNKKKPLLYEIPEMTVEEMSNYLMDKLNLTGIRIVGSYDTKICRVFMAEHVQGQQPWGNPDNDKIKTIREMNVDAIIPFEIVDWTVSAYVRDSCSVGIPKTIFEVGHFNMEELGMKHIAAYIDKIDAALGGKIPVEYIQSGDSFSYVTRG